METVKGAPCRAARAILRERLRLLLAGVPLGHHGRGLKGRRGRLAAWSVALLLLPGMLKASAPAERPQFDPGLAGFSLRVQDTVIPYRVLGAFVLPEEALHVTLASGASPAEISMTSTSGEVAAAKPGVWHWRAPREPGLYPLVVARRGSEDRITLNVFVMVPFDRVRDGRLNGYRIGEYPRKPLKGLSIYTRPKGFVEITPENMSTPISPHFTLGQFLCKQESGFPKYLVLRQTLLLKLELLLQTVNQHGLRCDGFEIMSGYRTPYYNAAIGNVQYSRHVWGGAADIYIDESPRDGVMDDLDGDGLISVRDAAKLYNIVDSLFGKKRYEPYVGGLGQYDATQAHGPFVHVDVRGFRARWGT